MTIGARLDHNTRLLKFENAAEKIYQKYSSDNEAKIFYALALKAASDPQDKTFAKQRKAGELLSTIFANQPDHPGIAHYLIHVYDYPELAELGLVRCQKVCINRIVISPCVAYAFSYFYASRPLGRGGSIEYQFHDCRQMLR